MATESLIRFPASVRAPAQFGLSDLNEAWTTLWPFYIVLLSPCTWLGARWTQAGCVHLAVRSVCYSVVTTGK